MEESKINCTTVDNTSKIVKAVEQVMEWPYLPCFGYTLNLAVKAGLAIPRIQKIVSKCSSMVTHFRRSRKVMYVFKEKQSLPEHSLIQDIFTTFTFHVVPGTLQQSLWGPLTTTSINIIQIHDHDSGRWDPAISTKLIEKIEFF